MAMIASTEDIRVACLIPGSREVEDETPAYSAAALTARKINITGNENRDSENMKADKSRVARNA